MDKIIQITEDIAIHVDNLQFIEQIKKGNPEQPYPDNSYYATLEQCLRAVQQDLMRKELNQDKEIELEEAIKVVKEVGDKIEQKIESLDGYNTP